MSVYLCVHIDQTVSYMSKLKKNICKTYMIYPLTIEWQYIEIMYGICFTWILNWHCILYIELVITIIIIALN